MSDICWTYFDEKEPKKCSTITVKLRDGSILYRGEWCRDRVFCWWNPSGEPFYIERGEILAWIYDEVKWCGEI